MNLDGLLATLVIVLTPFSWLSAVILWRAARQRPRIGVLTERAVIAVAIGIMVTTGGILTFNRNADHSLFGVEAARIIFSLAVVAIGIVPVYWTVIWFLGRLGEGKS
jgi:hypothetical protein